MKNLLMVCLFISVFGSYVYAEEGGAFTDADLQHYHSGNSVSVYGNTSGWGRGPETQRQGNSGRWENSTGSIYSTCQQQCDHDKDICKTGLPGGVGFNFSRGLEMCSREYRE